MKNPFRRLFSIAINQFARTGISFGLASNISAEAIGDAEWIKLTPYVDGDYWEMEKGAWKKYRQIVNAETGAKLVEAFNSVKEKAGANFRGLPIYSGHPDADPQRWPDERRLGGIMDVEAREDGIWVKPAWNDLGKQNLAEGYLVYPSPAWPYDLRTKARTGQIIPVELRSVGMTNTPRITSVPAWTNSDPISEPETTNEPNIMDLKKIAKLLGLDPATATEESIIAALKNAMGQGDAANAAKTEADKMAEAEKGKAMAACSERDQAKADAEKFRKLAVNSTITAAINGRKITAAEQPAWETKLATNFDEASAELANKAATLPNESLHLTQRTGDLSTPAGRKVAFNAAVDAHMGKGLGYDAAINAMRANPDEAALLKAMETATA